MNKTIEVIKEFPGVKKGDIFTYNEKLSLYELMKTETEVGEDYEKSSYVSVSLSPDYVETQEDYFSVVKDDAPEAIYSIDDVQNYKTFEDIVDKMNELVDTMNNYDMEPSELDRLRNTLWTLEWVLGIVEEN